MLVYRLRSHLHDRRRSHHLRRSGAWVRAEDKEVGTGETIIAHFPFIISHFPFDPNRTMSRCINVNKAELTQMENEK
jgi:hypothetical protein